MTQQRDIDVEKSRTRELMDQALPADADTEDLLLELYDTAAKRRKDPELERYYERLRGQAVRRLRQDGPRFFLDSSGVKRYAWPTTPETLEVDVEEFVRLHEAGEMPEVDLDKVMPRQPNREQLRRYIAKRSRVNRNPDGSKDGQIPMRVVTKTMRYVPGTARVSFSSDEDRDDQDG